MRFLGTKWFLASVVVVVLVLGTLVFAFVQKESPKPLPAKPAESAKLVPKTEIIGASVGARAIKAYTYGTGKTRLLFVGGIHGGYEWNSVLLAYQFMDYLEAHPTALPANLTVSVVPSANPDGVFKVVGKEGRFTALDASTDKTILASGRFNAHTVDLNRNFDCKWKPESTWQSRPVSAGTAAFSEPEAQAIRSFVLKNKPDVVVFWHSQANAVYASECTEGMLPVTLDAMNAYAKAAGYTPVKSFDAYPITGDAEGWLASIHIPAITVELKTHETVEWEQNWAGIKALFTYFSARP